MSTRHIKLLQARTDKSKMTLMARLRGLTPKIPSWVSDKQPLRKEVSPKSQPDQKRLESLLLGREAAWPNAGK